LDALADAERALEWQPSHFSAQMGRGLCLMNMGRHKDAEAAFGKALRLYPFNSNISTTMHSAKKHAEEA
jgi:Flp pilus assembly protein TadD